MIQFDASAAVTPPEAAPLQALARELEGAGRTGDADAVLKGLEAIQQLRGAVGPGPWSTPFSGTPHDLTQRSFSLWRTDPG